MAETPRQNGHAPGRLLDIVVEEVSLVDRAANEHRFLIVKRSNTPMVDTTESDGQESGADGAATEETAINEDTRGPATDPTATTDAATPDSLLTTAVTALEGLTSTVELLGTMGTQAARAQLGPLATELKATAEALLAHTGGTLEAKPTDEGIRDLESAENASAATDGAAFTQQLAAVRGALAEIASVLSTPRPKPETDEGSNAGAHVALSAELTTTLAALGESFRTLNETVKEQQQRLARVEKQFGLPNSSQSPESTRRPEPDEVGWPMDLNNPMDRESVDRAVSFHDV